MIYGEQGYADAAEREAKARERSAAAWAEQQAAQDEPNPDAPYSSEQESYDQEFERDPALATEQTPHLQVHRR